MRKIRELLFTENEFSAAVFPFGMMAIMGIVWMLMKGFIFRYFIWQNEIHSGVFLNFIYVAVGVLNSWIVDDWCKNRSIIRMVTAGVTPLGTVLTLRWLFSGFITSKLLIAVMITYSVFIAFQTIRIIMKKKKLRVIGRALNNILATLSVISIIGMWGYCLTGMYTADEPAASSIKMAEDGELWDSNQDMLRLWKEDTYTDLSDEKKKTLFQQLIDLECAYWGIEPVKLVVEEYESETLMGYYVDEDHIISIREEMFGLPREEVINTLLHETHHAYVHKLMESVDLRDKNIEKNKNLRIYKELYKYKEGIENYISAETDYDSYYNNPIEVAAREYAGEWTVNYLNYIDRI